MPHIAPINWTMALTASIVCVVILMAKFYLSYPTTISLTEKKSEKTLKSVSYPWK